MTGSVDAYCSPLPAENDTVVAPDVRAATLSRAWAQPATLSRYSPAAVMVLIRLPPTVSTDMLVHAGVPVRASVHCMVADRPDGEPAMRT